jgi:hypothetical protein
MQGTRASTHGLHAWPWLQDITSANHVPDITGFNIAFLRDTSDSLYTIVTDSVLPDFNL